MKKFVSLVLVTFMVLGLLACGNVATEGGEAGGNITDQLKDGQLLVDVEFEPAEINELAEKIYQKLLFGSLKAVSVGFMPIGKGQWGKDEESLDGKNPTYYYAGQELLEVSVVNIPANPNALKKGVELQDSEMEQLRSEFVKEVKMPEQEDDAERLASCRRALEKEVIIARSALHNL